MKLEELLEAYLERLKIQNYAKGTLGHVRPVLETLAAYLLEQNIRSSQEITANDVQEIQKTFFLHSLETAAHKSSHLRLFLKHAYACGETKTDLSLEIKPVQRARALPRRVLTRKEVAAFLSQPDIETHKGIRDRAILELIYSSALRRSEVERLTVYDIDMFRGELRVSGKGDKERIVPVGKMARYWIHRYMKEVRGFSRNEQLFLHVQSCGALKNSGIGLLVKHYATLFGKKVTAHDLRHAAATHMLQNGAPSVMVQVFLGHSQLFTTQIYTHVLDEDLRTVIERHHPRKGIKHIS